MLNLKLLNLKVDDEKIFFEQQLIENRSDFVLGGDTKICAHHCFTLGTGYKSKKTCEHSHHTHQPKQVKTSPTSVASFSVIDRFTENYGGQFPIGGAVCNTHCKEESVSKMLLLEPGPAVEEDDTNYILEVVVLIEEVLFSASTVSTNEAKCLDTSPVSTLKMTRLENVNAKAKEGYQKSTRK